MKRIVQVIQVKGPMSLCRHQLACTWCTSFLSMRPPSVSWRFDPVPNSPPLTRAPLDHQAQAEAGLSRHLYFQTTTSVSADYWAVLQREEEQAVVIIAVLKSNTVLAGVLFSPQVMTFWSFTWLKSQSLCDECDAPSNVLRLGVRPRPSSTRHLVLGKNVVEPRGPSCKSPSEV